MVRSNGGWCNEKRQFKALAICTLLAVSTLLPDVNGSPVKSLFNSSSSSSSSGRGSKPSSVSSSSSYNNFGRLSYTNTISNPGPKPVTTAPKPSAPVKSSNMRNVGFVNSPPKPAGSVAQPAGSINKPPNKQSPVQQAAAKHPDPVQNNNGDRYMSQWSHSQHTLTSSAPLSSIAATPVTAQKSKSSGIGVGRTVASVAIGGAAGVAGAAVYNSLPSKDRMNNIPAATTAAPAASAGQVEGVAAIAAASASVASSPAPVPDSVTAAAVTVRTVPLGTDGQASDPPAAFPETTNNSTASEATPVASAPDGQASVPLAAFPASTDSTTASEVLSAAAVPDHPEALNQNTTTTGGELPPQQPAKNGTGTMSPLAQASVVAAAFFETNVVNPNAKQYISPPGRFSLATGQYVPPGEYDPATGIFTPGRYIPDTAIFQSGTYNPLTQMFTPGRYEANGQFIADPNNPPLSLAPNDGTAGQAVATIPAFATDQSIKSTDNTTASDETPATTSLDDQASVSTTPISVSTDESTSSEEASATAVPDPNAIITEGEQPPQLPANNGTETTSSLAQVPVDAAAPVETTTVNSNAKQYIHTDPDSNNPPLSLARNVGTAGEAVATTPAFAADQSIKSTDTTTASDETPATTSLDDQASVSTTPISVSTDESTSSEEASATTVPDPNATATEGEQPPQQPASNGTETTSSLAQVPGDAAAPVETTTVNSNAKQYIHTDPDSNNPPLSLAPNDGTAGEAVATTPAFAADQSIKSTDTTTASDETPATTSLDDQASVPTTPISVSTDDSTSSEEASATTVPDPNATATEGEQPPQQPASNGTETMTPIAQAPVDTAAPVETTVNSNAKQCIHTDPNPNNTTLSLAANNGTAGQAVAVTLAAAAATLEVAADTPATTADQSIQSEPVPSLNQTSSASPKTVSLLSVVGAFIISEGFRKLVRC